MPYREPAEKDKDAGDDSGKAKKPDLTQAQWWRAKELEKAPHEILDNLVTQIEDDQQSRYDAYREYARMFGSDAASGEDALGMLMSGELSQNELANTLETLWAQVFKNKIVPAVCTSDADYEEWSRARAYGRWIEGAFDDAEVFEDAIPRAGIYCLVYGTGPIKVDWQPDSEDKDVAHIRAYAVNPKYLLVDRLEAKHGRPRSLFEKTHVDRYVLWEMYSGSDESYYGTPEERKVGIDKATSNDDEELGIAGSKQQCDMITVREAWHLPSAPGAKDGRHVIWIKGCTLVDEPWEWDCFPFVFIRFGCRIEGFWGESAVKRLAPTQKLLDKLNQKIDESQDVMGVPRILMRTGAIIKKTDIDDVPGGILECNDINGIKEWNAECVSPELYADRDAAPRKMRSLLGVSDFEVQQQIPQGMRDVSGAFLERWVDQGQARHAMFHREYENAIVKLAYLFMRTAEQLQKDGYDVTVPCPGGYAKSDIEVLEFKDVTVDRKRLKLRVQPMSQLPQTFAGKVEAISKLQEAGVAIDPKTVMRMVEIPDPSAATDILVSDEEIIMKNLHYMCKNGQYIPPLPFDNHDLIIRLTTQFINHYRVRPNADMEVVALLAQYIDDAIDQKRGLGGTDPNAPPSTMDAVMGAQAQGMAPPGAGVPPMGGPPGAPPVPQGGVPPVNGMAGPPGGPPMGGGLPPQMGM